MTDSLLNNNNNDNVNVDENKNYLEELVGDGKKFKTPEDLAKGKYEADLTIVQRNRQLDELRADYMRLQEEYKAGPKLQELLDQLKSQQNASNRNDNNNSNDAVNDNAPAFDPKQIDSLISNKLQEFELTKKQTENLNAVKAKLEEHFGNSYESVLKERMNSLGLDVNDIDALAKKSPKAFFNTLGLEERRGDDTFQAPFSSQRRNDNFLPKTEKRTWAYYEKMRKENNQLYHNPKTQVQMHKDAEALGEAFKDGNWKQLNL